ncbi:hypothetical protein [Fuerstiella marisgermanici]|uniref:hypothetical protein n=1 Tax=Fuerstiella marisgermanici TaxID=1891926 RepID=UPI0011AB3333|nr:hypothetical protein [Fuerstiella marisgermanici]
MRCSFLKTLAATFVTCAGLSGLHAQDYFFAPTTGTTYDSRLPMNPSEGRYDQRPYEHRQMQPHPSYRPTGLDDPHGDFSPNTLAPGGCIGGRCRRERGDRVDGADQAANRNWRNSRRDVNAPRRYQARLAENSGWDPLNDVMSDSGRQHFSGDGHGHGDGMGRRSGPGHRGGRCGNGQRHRGNMDCDCPDGQCDCVPNHQNLQSNYRHSRPNGYDDFDLIRRNNAGPYVPVSAPYRN